MKRLKQLLTPGHAFAALAAATLVYLLWGRFFTPGGTGSNVVLGLLVALVGIYMGATNFGPNIDDAIAGAEGRKRRAVREAEALAGDVQAMLARTARDKKPKLLSQHREAITQGVEVFSASIAAAASLSVVEAVAAIQKAHVGFDEVLKQHLPDERVSVFAQVRGLFGAFAVAIVLRLWLVAPFQIPSGSMIPTLLIGDHLFVSRASYGLQIPSRYRSGPLAGVTSFLPEQPYYFARWSMPKAGDVVVFEAPPWVPQNGGEDWIKRVIALPGQRVRREGLTVFVDDQPYALAGGDDGGVMTTYMDYEEYAGDRGAWHERVAMRHDEGIPGKTHATFSDMPPSTTDWPNLAYPYPQQRGLSCTATECRVNEGYVFVMGDNRDHSSDGRVWGAVPIDSIKGRASFVWVSVDGSAESLHVGRFVLPRFRLDRLFMAIQ